MAYLNVGSCKMKNRKQLLMDFYLVLLSFPPDSVFRVINQNRLYASVRDALAFELCEDAEVVQNIFEKMAMEDK